MAGTQTMKKPTHQQKANLNTIASNLWPGNKYMQSGQMGGREWEEGEWHKAWWWVAYYTEVIGRYETTKEFDDRLNEYMDFFDACYAIRDWRWFIFGLSKLLDGVNWLRQKHGERVLEGPMLLEAKKGGA